MFILLTFMRKGIPLKVYLGSHGKLISDKPTTVMTNTYHPIMLMWVMFAGISILLPIHYAIQLFSLMWDPESLEAELKVKE